MKTIAMLKKETQLLILNKILFSMLVKEILVHKTMQVWAVKTARTCGQQMLQPLKILFQNPS